MKAPLQARHIGFTGTRQSPTTEQEEALITLFDVLALWGEPPIRLHHGCCIGADELAHYTAHKHGWGVTAHPPEDTRRMASLLFHAKDEVHHPLPYLARNHEIVDASSLLIAMPAQPFDHQRSGTWATVRYARRKRLNVLIIRTDGLVDARGSIRWQRDWMDRQARKGNT